MKNIVFDCERMKYHNTGIYHYCMNLGRQLEILLDPSREKISYYKPPNVRGIFLREKQSIRQHSLHKFYLPDTGNFDIWHATYQNTDYMPSRNKKIKVVLTIHDLNFMYDNKKSASKKKKYLQHLQHNINRADAIVCISEYSKNDVMQYCETGNKPVHIIHNGTNPLTVPELSSYSYHPGKKFLFSIGVVTRKKNFHALLPLLIGNNMELLIAGRKDDPAYLSYLLQCAREMKVEERVKLLGNISEDEKSWYFQNCYAFASPSTAEGFCMPVTEAMSVGKPLFLSRKTALPEIAGKVAFYFSDFSRNNMQHTFLDGMQQYKTTNMQQDIRERANAFCWDKAALKYLEVYRSL